MRRRAWSGLSKIMVLAVIMLLALGSVGVTYSRWIDTVAINGTVNLGTFGSYVQCGQHSPQVTCRTLNGEFLNVALVNAPAGSYYCDFIYVNDGTLPDKVNQVLIAPRTGTGAFPPGVSVTVTGLEVGAVIDPGTAIGTVHITLDSPRSLYFTVTLITGPWNQ